MSDNFYDFILIYMASKQGKNQMISFFNQQCILQLISFQVDALSGMDDHPFNQIEMLLENCDMVSISLDSADNMETLDSLSDIVVNIYKCCDYLKSYAHTIPYKETPTTRLVDKLIEQNCLKLDQLMFEPIDEILEDKMDSAEINFDSDWVHTSSKPTSMTKEEFFALDDETIFNEPYSGPERADISILRKFGYSVDKDNTVSDSKRQELLHTLITNKLVTKSKVIAHLKYLIRINGRKASNYNALAKWKSDLEYVLKL